METLWGILRLLGLLLAWEVGSFSLLWALMFVCKRLGREKPGLPGPLYAFEMLYVVYHFPAILILTHKGEKAANGVAVAGLTFGAYGTALSLLILGLELIVYLTRK